MENYSHIQDGASMDSANSTNTRKITVEIKNKALRKRLYLDVNRKQYRKHWHSVQIRRNKYDKKFIRKFQRTHFIQNPVKLIPPGLYCYRLAESSRIPDAYDHLCELPKIITCPFYYTIQIPEDKREDCVAIVAMGQNHIGGCHFLNQTDIDFNGNGLLWDMCKECGINERN